RGEVAQWFHDMLVEFKDDPEFILEGVLLDTNEQLCIRMDELGITRAELAERLGVSRQYVTKLLNGKPNLTLKSLVDIALALDMDITVRIGGSQASRDAVLKPAKRAAKARGNGRRKERVAA
ncbi:MAG: helix-turn-helix transcriptional regulator, partial [Planctomycetota bacterium]|nr:helix-turn-helix transcriptional regulator [Planctomycetota bacterium]